MNRRNLQRFLLCVAAVVQLPGCYADSVTAPEPTLTTAGAFIAVPFEPVLPGGAAGAAGQAGQSGDADGLYRMIRVLAVFDVTNDLAIFHFQYGLVGSLEEAREATKSRASGPPPPVSITSLSSLESREAVVVGYRSVTEEEQDAIR
ncbi:MAG TPA: hypothetical protein VI197_06720 [Polyangiaceae bacterium]